MSPGSTSAPTAHDTGFVEVAQRFFTDVWNIACDFFRPKLCIARQTSEFFDVDRCEDVVTHNTLGDQDRVFEVVAVPRHKRDEHVFTKRQLTHIRGRTVSNNVALWNRRQLSPADAG